MAGFDNKIPLSKLIQMAVGILLKCAGTVDTVKTASKTTSKRKSTPHPEANDSAMLRTISNESTVKKSPRKNNESKFIMLNQYSSLTVSY